MRRILVIDDDTALRQLFATALKQAGYEVFEAANGHEGIQVQEQYSCDLVILDMFMPESDGLEVIFQLKSLHSHAKIIAISGGGSWTQHGRNLGADDPLDIARRFGADRTMKKPIKIHELLQAVENLVGRERLTRQAEGAEIHKERQHRILLIEDDLSQRQLFATALTGAGYEVLQASNGIEGLEQFRQHHCDLVVTDIFMPEKEGLEIIFELRAQHDRIKIIAISGGGRWGQHGTSFGSSEPLDIARRFGADRTLQKPLKIHQFLTVVQELLLK